MIATYITNKILKKNGVAIFFSLYCNNSPIMQTYAAFDEFITFIEEIQPLYGIYNCFINDNDDWYLCSTDVLKNPKGKIYRGSKEPPKDLKDGDIYLQTESLLVRLFRYCDGVKGNSATMKTWHYDYSHKVLGPHYDNSIVQTHWEDDPLPGKKFGFFVIFECGGLNIRAINHESLKIIYHNDKNLQGKILTKIPNGVINLEPL